MHKKIYFDPKKLWEDPEDLLNLAEKHAGLDYLMKGIAFHGDRLKQKPDLYENNKVLKNRTLPVGVGITVQNIEKFSSGSMDLTLSFDLKQNWIDRRLAH